MHQGLICKNGDWFCFDPPAINVESFIGHGAELDCDPSWLMATTLPILRSELHWDSQIAARRCRRAEKIICDGWAWISWWMGMDFMMNDVMASSVMLYWVEPRNWLNEMRNAKLVKQLLIPINYEEQFPDLRFVIFPVIYCDFWCAPSWPRWWQQI